MKDRFKFRTYIPDLKFFKYWGWVDEGHYVGLCPSGDYQMDELLEKYTQQCIGHRDKNNELIYEGDIVKYAPNEDTNEAEWVTDVIVWGGKYEYPAFDLAKHDFECNGLSYLFNEGWIVEIIGNVYDEYDLTAIQQKLDLIIEQKGFN